MNITTTISLATPMTMTMESAISAGDQHEPILDQLPRGVALRRRLPFVAGQGYEGKEDPGDLPLTGTGTTPIDRPQHSLGPQQLLTRHARIGRNGSSMQRCQQPQDRFHPIETLDAERNDGGQRLIGFPILGKKKVKALSVGQIALNVAAVLGCGIDRSVRQRQRTARWPKNRRC